MSDSADTPLKQCKGPCGQFFPKTSDYFHRNGKGEYLKPLCKECASIQRRARYTLPEVKAQTKAQTKIYRETHGEQMKEYQRNYYKANKERVKERIIIYRQTNKERVKEREKIYRERHKSSSKEYQQAYYQARKERINARNKAHYESHKEQINEHISAYRHAHPMQGRLAAQRRRVRKKAVPGIHTATQIAEQLKRQRYRCYYAACGHAKFKKEKGKYVYHIEHTFPISRVAGTGIPANDISYVVLACPACNDSKGDKFPWEWPEGGRLL